MSTRCVCDYDCGGDPPSFFRCNRQQLCPECDTCESCGERLATAIVDGDKVCDGCRPEAEHDRLLAQEEWTSLVRELPKAYNFVFPGQCNSADHRARYGLDSPARYGLLNEYGRCEACQNAFASMMQAAEDHAYGSGR